MHPPGRAAMRAGQGYQAIDIRPLVCVLIFLAVFAGCQGGRYYMAMSKPFIPSELVSEIQKALET